MKRIQALCNPALLYLVLSGISILMLLFQNMENPNEYCVGNLKCPVENKWGVFIGKCIYVAFWTWILDLICKSGHTKVAWFILFLPLVLFFILIGLFILVQLKDGILKPSTQNKEPMNSDYLL